MDDELTKEEKDLCERNRLEYWAGFKREVDEIRELCKLRDSGVKIITSKEYKDRVRVGLPTDGYVELGTLRKKYNF